MSNNYGYSLQERANLEGQLTLYIMEQKIAHQSKAGTYTRKTSWYPIKRSREELIEMYGCIPQGSLVTLTPRATGRGYDFWLGEGHLAMLLSFLYGDETMEEYLVTEHFKLIQLQHGQLEGSPFKRLLECRTQNSATLWTFPVDVPVLDWVKYDG